jgi:hypothetical protein
MSIAGDGIDRDWGMRYRTEAQTLAKIRLEREDWDSGVGPDGGRRDAAAAHMLWLDRRSVKWKR